MNDQRPTRWPWSADSSRNAGSPGASSRSFRNAETGVSQSSMKVWRERDQVVLARQLARPLERSARCSRAAEIDGGAPARVR